MKGIKGMPEEETLEELTKKISKDKELKAIHKVQDKLASILEMEVKKKKDCQNNIKRLTSLLEGYEGTFTGGLIEEALDKHRKMLPNLRG
jgi:hypothetical protein